MQLYFEGKQIGGYNTAACHWYFLEKFVSDHGGATIPERLGFIKKSKKQKSKQGKEYYREWWILSGTGPAEARAFLSALREMTGVDLSGE